MIISIFLFRLFEKLAQKGISKRANDARNVRAKERERENDTNIQRERTWPSYDWIYFRRFRVVYVLGSFGSPFEYEISEEIISGHSIYWMEIACYKLRNEYSFGFILAFDFNFQRLFFLSFFLSLACLMRKHTPFWSWWSAATRNISYKIVSQK